MAGVVVGGEVVVGDVAFDLSAASLGVRSVVTLGIDAARTTDRRCRNWAKVMNDEGSQDFTAPDARTLTWTLLLLLDERSKETTVM
ncbi:MAG: hypothetical protein WCF24_02455 [Acidimicrobiales bacterium]